MNLVCSHLLAISINLLDNVLKEEKQKLCMTFFFENMQTEQIAQNMVYAVCYFGFYKSIYE